MTGRTVVVGGSVGGTRVARDLRQGGYDGAIVVVESEPHLPYDKPPLSKASLSADADAAVPLLTRAEADELGIELRLGTRAVSLDADAHRVELSDGTSLEFDQLVIATGAAARPSPWGQLPGLHVLRSLDDAMRLRDALDGGQTLLVVGAGFIGSEIASVARKRGMDVTIVDPMVIPMSRIMGPTLGTRFVDLHRDHGVDVRFGVIVDGILETEDGLLATFSDGTSVLADVVVVGIGARVNTEWLKGSGLLIEDGVVCDEFCRAVGHADIHVVGDVARWLHVRHGRTVRTEHWTNAIEQAACVARNILSPGAPNEYVPVEYVWSDQYDWKIQIVGVPDPLVDPQVVETTDPFRLAAFWKDEAGVTAGAVTVNWSKASVLARRSIGDGTPADDALGKLAPQVAP